MQHQPQSKRQRPSEHVPVARNDIPDDSSRDCYDAVLQEGGHNPGNYNLELRHSWLNHATPTYCAGAAANNSTTPAPIPSMRNHDHLNTNAEDDDSTISPIETLRRQLLQVKRRLWPAAEHCADASNINDDYSGATSSASSEFAHARRLCNPLEPLGEGRNGGMNLMFMNRSAIKLANLDALLSFSLATTTSVPGGGTGTGGGRRPFLFVDLCGSPGGFSEYIMKRCQSTGSSTTCLGFGMSLVGRNEHGHGTPWKLPPEIDTVKNGCHVHYRICYGADGTGDIYRWENVEALQQEIQSELYERGWLSSSSPLSSPLQQQQHSLSSSNDAKVHLVVADGGFDAQRDSECQEELTQKIIVCQVAAALSLLAPGGTLVVKFFGFQTPVIRTVLTSLSEFFDEIIVTKPISSRPASSERYVVGRGFHGTEKFHPFWNGPQWRDQMFLGRGWNMTSSSSSSSTAVGGSSRLDQFLDDCDRDLLTLNLKACFAILSCLERKTEALNAGDGSYGSYHNHHDWRQTRPTVDVERYKQAWKLN